MLRRFAPAAWYYLVVLAARLVLIWVAPQGHAPVAAWWMVVLVAAAVSTAAGAQFAIALRLSDRVPLSRDMNRRAVLYQAVAALGTSGALRLSAVLAVRFAPGVPMAPVPAPLWFMLLGDAVIYLILVAACQALRGMPDSRVDEISRQRLDTAVHEARQRRTEAHLRALKTELNAYFVSNTLTAIRALVRTDITAADRILTRLGDILRDVVGRTRESVATLQEELQSLDLFVEIERARFGDRLRIDIDVSADLMDALVPDLLLRSLFTDAATRLHRTNGACGIHIAAAVTGKHRDRIRITVSTSADTPGSAAPADAKPSSMANLQARVTELYGPSARIELTGGLAHTHRIQVTLPRRTEDAPDALDTVTRRERAQRRTASAGRIAAAVATFWLFTWALYASRPAGLRLPDRDVIAGTLGIAAIMLGACLGAFRLSREYPWVRDPLTERGGGWRAVGVHALAGSVCGVFLLVERVTFAWATGRASLFTTPHLLARVSALFMATTLLMFVFSGVAHAVEGFKRQRAKEVGVRRLEIALVDARRRRAEAELYALKAELNPHFVGNALSSVLTLLRTDRDAAERMLTQLGDLLTSAVARTATQEVTLREELVTLQPFLAVEGARLGRELEVRLAVDDETLVGRLPHMILQPLVENAVKHGLALRRGSGRIEVAARRSDGTLEVMVRDDGVGLHEPRMPARRAGVGLANTRARLSELYGDEARLDLSSHVDGGTIARLTIPWHEAPADAAALLEQQNRRDPQRVMDAQ